MNIWQKRAPGVLLCLAVALLAWFLVELAPALEIVGSAVLAILFGMVLCAVMKNKDKVKDGVAFTSKKVLQYAVILLGFGLNLRKVGEVGLTSLPIILSTIATSLIVAFLMSRALHMPPPRSSVGLRKIDGAWPPPRRRSTATVWSGS